MVREMGMPDVDVTGVRQLATSMMLENPEDASSSSVAKVEPPAAASAHQVGERVKAQCSGWKSPYWGEIYSVNQNGTFGIMFEDGEKIKEVKEKQIHRNAKEDEFLIGTKVRAKFAGKGHYYPATIEMVNDDGTFDLKYMDGDSEEKATKNNLQIV